MAICILSFDISSRSTGWSVLKNGRFYKREGLDYGLIKPATKLSLAEKLAYFRKEIVKVLNMVKPDVVGIEDVFKSKNSKVLIILSRFSGVAIEAVYGELGIVPSIVQAREARTVWGTQVKEEVFENVCNRYKIKEWKFDTHNDVADSLALSFYLSKNKE